jgi:hypothetical protein
MLQSLGEVVHYGAAIGACLTMELGREDPGILRRFIETSTRSEGDTSFWADTDELLYVGFCVV